MGLFISFKRGVVNFANRWDDLASLCEYRLEALAIKFLRSF
jgi:hypothetical protein